MMNLLPLGLRRLKTCKRCTLQFKKIEATCPHCTDINDKELQDLKKTQSQRLEASSHLGLYFVGVTILIVLLMAGIYVS